MWIEGGRGRGQPPFCDVSPFSPLQPEEEAETVFDVEPSSTTSTPTSLVSFCLHPGDMAGGWGLARVAHSNKMGEHQYLVPTLGTGEEPGPLGSLS